VHARSNLRVWHSRRGARAYVAIGGGIAVPPVLASRSTHIGSRLGGLEGRALRAGDVIPLGERRGSAGQRSPGAAISPLPSGLTILRLLPGPHLEHFADQALEELQSASYTIDPASDRMGFRLSGPKLTHVQRPEMISEATPLGGLQVPPSGLPILLMVDRQTTGGYPIVATVITADVSLAGQLGPGDTVLFRACSMQDAITALIAREQSLMFLESTGSIRSEASGPHR